MSIDYEHTTSRRRTVSGFLAHCRQLIPALAGQVAYRLAGFARKITSTSFEPEPNNVAVICDSFLRYGSSQAIGLQHTGWNVTLYYVDRKTEFATSSGDRAFLLDRARSAGVDVVRISPRHVRSLLRDLVRLHRDLRRRRIAIGVIQSHADPRYATLGLTLPTALILHDPATHSGDSVSALPLTMRLVARFAECTSACLIIHSSLLLDQIRPLLRRVPIGVVPHGAEMALAPAAVPRDRRLLIFGRLFAYKGVDTALEALDLLPEKLSDVRLIIAGRGPLAELGRDHPGVELRDEYISERDVDDLLDDVRLVLLPYKDATQSGVGLLAVARGVPCVVSAAGGLPELVQDSEPSLVTPPGDAKLLADTIVAHIDHDERLRSAIYHHAAKNYSWPVVAQKLCAELCRLGLIDAMVPPRG